jgi:O-antigen ligase
MAPLPRPARQALERRRRWVLDGVGLALVGMMLVWTLVTSLDRADARPGPVVALLVGMALLVGVARWTPGDLAGRIPGLVAIAVTGAVVLSFPEVLRAGGAPTGYANANATLASLGVVAAVAAGTTGARRTRAGWFLVAVGLVGSVGATRSVAGLLALMVVAGLALGSVALRSATLAAVGGLVAVSLSLGVTTAVAAGADPLGLGERSELRGELWASALDASREHPLRGLGPGGYERLAPVSSDADHRWAHHGYLQQAADQGVPGLLLLLALIGWGYARLWVAGGSDPTRAIVGASALTVVCLHASVDHVLHHAAIPLVATLLLGWAIVAPGGASAASRRP